MTEVQLKKIFTAEVLKNANNISENHPNFTCVFILEPVIFSATFH